MQISLNKALYFNNSDISDRSKTINSATSAVNKNCYDDTDIISNRQSYFVSADVISIRDIQGILQLSAAVKV